MLEMTQSKRNDPYEIYERVARLEADVSWLKKLATTNVFISAVSLITILIMFLMFIVK